MAIIMSKMQDKKIAPIEISIWNIPRVSYGDRVYYVINSKSVKLGSDYIITDVDSEDKDSYLDIVEDIMWDKLRIQGVSDIGHIKGLSSISFLKELSLVNGSISKVKSIEKFFSLEVIDLSYNKISNISGLEGLFNLVKLDLSNNEIKEIGNLSGLLNLKELCLDNNNIREIDGEKLPYSLEMLSIKENPNPNFKNLDGHRRLKNNLKHQFN